MNPDQFWEQSDLCPYCLQYRLPKNISRREVATGRLRVKTIWERCNQISLVGFI